jgi:hypothetical protein
LFAFIKWEVDLTLPYYKGIFAQETETKGNFAKSGSGGGDDLLNLNKEAGCSGHSLGVGNVSNARAKKS